MAREVTIGDVARSTGLPVRTIRFYESQGVVRPRRAENGFRSYTANDIRRLQLARRARVLGLPLTEVKSLVERAFASDCATFADDMLGRIGSQRAAINQRIVDLQDLNDQLAQLGEHLRAERLGPNRQVADCDWCAAIDAPSQLDLPVESASGSD